MSSQSPVNRFVRTINFRRKSPQTNIIGTHLEKLCHRDMYIAPSGGHTSFNSHMPFKTDSKEM